MSFKLRSGGRWARATGRSATRRRPGDPDRADIEERSELEFTSVARKYELTAAWMPRTVAPVVAPNCPMLPGAAARAAAGAARRRAVASPARHPGPAPPRPPRRRQWDTKLCRHGVTVSGPGALCVCLLRFKFTGSLVTPAVTVAR
jgi:hypothetical protein